MNFINLRYTYDKIQSAKFALMGNNIDQIYWDMVKIELQMKPYLNEDFVDIDNEYLYYTALKIQMEDNFYKILKDLNDIRSHLGYGVQKHISIFR